MLNSHCIEYSTITPRKHSYCATPSTHDLEVDHAALCKKNYSPNHHKDSFTLTITNKNIVFNTLDQILPYLKVPQKKKRAKFILEHYDKVTPRNGRYNEEMLKQKIKFEEQFFLL